MNSHIVGTYNLVKLSELMVKSDERSPLGMLLSCPGCFIVNAGLTASLTSVDKRWRAAAGCTVYCVLCHALDCTVPGPGSETSSECSVLE